MKLSDLTEYDPETTILIYDTEVEDFVPVSSVIYDEGNKRVYLQASEVV